MCDLWEGRCEYQEFDENVFITNYFGAKDLKKLEKNNITHILVCANELPKAHERTGKFTYHQLPIADNTHSPIQNYFKESIEFIENAVNGGGRVLVHCAAGSSRSGTIAIAYKMKKRSIPYVEAHAHLVQLRPIVQPNPGFAEVLQAFKFD